MESRKSTHLMLLSLPYDVTMDIVTRLNSLTALYNLLIAFPGLQPFFTSSFQFIVRAILANHFQHPEMYRYLYAIMTARYHNPHEWLHYFLGYFFTSHNRGYPLGLPSFVPRTIDTLYYMGQVLDSVQFCIPYGQRVWSSALQHNRYRPGYPPASESWISLSLLRIQLYAELFHQPLDSSDAIDNWEIDLQLLKDYWDYFASLPLFRMCKYIYTAIAVSAGHEVEYKWVPINTRVPDLVCIRGLPQTRRVMEGQTCTSFGLSYVRRLVKRSPRALEHLDPESGVWHHNGAVWVIFGWRDGPHGGLGQTKKHEQYLCPAGSASSAVEWVSVSPGYLEDEEDSESDGGDDEGEGEGEV